MIPATSPKLRWIGKLEPSCGLTGSTWLPSRSMSRRRPTRSLPLDAPALAISSLRLRRMVVSSASRLGLGIVLGGTLEDPGRRHDGRLGRLEDGGWSERPAGGEQSVKAAPAGIFDGCLQCLPVLERGVEQLLLNPTDLLTWRRVGLLAFGVAEESRLEGAKRLDLLVGVAAA